MRYRLLMTGLLFSCVAKAQELFTFTEPASNMAAKSIGIRLNNFIIAESHGSGTNYYLVPEIMTGVSRKTMLHFDAFFSNRNSTFSPEGGSMYAKYRFLSKDGVQQHFRMAVYGRYSFNNSNIDAEEINLYGHNTGFEAGIIATQLLHKVALSSTASFVKATDNGKGHAYPYGPGNSRALNYSLSVGKLLLPGNYKDYKQTNVNGMLELLGQYHTGSGNYYVDVAPSVQFIVKSVARIDVGYRKELGSTLLRAAPTSLFVRIEYNFFNVL